MVVKLADTSKEKEAKKMQQNSASGVMNNSNFSQQYLAVSDPVLLLPLLGDGFYTNLTTVSYVHDYVLVCAAIGGCLWQYGQPEQQGQYGCVTRLVSYEYDCMRLSIAFV